MKKLCYTFFLLFFGLLAQAQNISVANFYYAENDLTARTHGTSVEDQNGNICALIKVETTEKGLWLFDVGMLGVTKTEMQNAAHPAEIWVYVPYSVTWISIQHEQLGKMSRYAFPCSIDKGCTYIMKLTTGKVTTIVEEEVREQYLTFQITPANAVLEVDGKLWEVGSDGSSTKFVSFGSYNYRVQAPNYHTEVGKVTVNDPEEAQKVTVNLKPDFVEVTLKVDADAEIWVNNEKKGVGKWTGQLGKGTYKMECKQANHEATVSTQEITEAMNGQTITLAAPKPFYGSLNIESTPNYAQIYIDGKAMGETPKFIKEILVGIHELKLTKEGCSDYVENITLAKGERKQVKAMLNNGREVTFSCNANNARLTIDGTPMSDANGTYKLTFGSHRIEAKADGYEDFAQTLSVSESSNRYSVEMSKVKVVVNTVSMPEGVKSDVKLTTQGDDFYDKKDYETALWCYLEAAKLSSEKNNGALRNRIGYMYQYGLGTSQDYKEAVKWYREAVELGNAYAQCNLGYMYEKGYGVTQDYSEAVKWYRKSADQGNATAQSNVGIMYRYGKGVTQNYTEAVKWYRKAADQGNATAQTNLGIMYRDGIGVSKDYSEAVKWYRRAVEQGDAQAQCHLGYMYEKGYGVTQDYAEAMKWYRKAADQGEVRAQTNLGIMYRDGIGVSKDYSEAVKWYCRAVEQGDAQAQCHLGYMYEKGYGVTQDYSEAVKWYRMSAEQGEATAQFNLGIMYQYGKGVPENKSEALKWYRKAAAQGYEKAQNKLKELE